MGKGKITIINEDGENQQEVERRPPPPITKPKKNKKNKGKVQTQLILDGQNQEIGNGEKDHHGEIQPKQDQQIKPKKTKLQQKYRLRHLAICFPDSILSIPQTQTLRAYFISEVARISSIFKVDQIVILQDPNYAPSDENFVPSQYLMRNLQYLETPQYLRKHLFKMHPDLKNAGLMNPIQCHHHLKTPDICEFREGVILNSNPNKGTAVDIGLKQPAYIQEEVEPNTRVTLRLNNYTQIDSNSLIQGEIVSPRTPRQQQNLYWGYNVRIAKNLKRIFKRQDYDIKILCNHHKGEAEQIHNITSFEDINLADKSMLIFFPGTDDLSTLLQHDSDYALTLFDHGLSFERVGVQRMRMEEQMFMGLQKLAKCVH